MIMLGPQINIRFFQFQVFLIASGMYAAVILNYVFNARFTPQSFDKKEEKEGEKIEKVQY